MQFVPTISLDDVELPSLNFFSLSVIMTNINHRLENNYLTFIETLQESKSGIAKPLIACMAAPRLIKSCFSGCFLIARFMPTNRRFATTMTPVETSATTTVAIIGSLTAIQPHVFACD